VDQRCLIPPAAQGEERHKNIFPVSRMKFKYYEINLMKSWEFSIAGHLGTLASIF